METRFMWDEHGVSGQTIKYIKIFMYIVYARAFIVRVRQKLQ